MKRIKKAFIIFLVLGITFPSEVVHALTFIPEFVAHYKHHNEEHHEVSFIGFVAEHIGFGEHDEHNALHDSQDHCPADHLHAVVSLTYFFQKRTTNFIEEADLYFSNEEKSPLPAYHFSASEFHSNIWQPPKIS